MADALLDRLLRRWMFPMVKSGNKFGLPYGQEFREGLGTSGEYPPAFTPFLERFLVALAGPEWQPGSYYPGGWFRSLAAQGADPLAARLSVEELRPFFRDELRVDGRGRWWLGAKPIKGRVLSFFLKHLHFDPALNLYCVRYQLESVEEAQYLHPEAPPLRVRRIDRSSDLPMLELNDGTREPLDPRSLWLGGEDRLFAKVRSSVWTVEFDDPARWDVLQTVEQSGDCCFVTLAGDRWELPVKE